MRNKFSELYWGIFLSALLAFLVVFRHIRNFIRQLFGELIVSAYPDPWQINWGSWLLVFGIVLLILLGLAIFLWRNQLKSTRTSRKKSQNAPGSL